MQSNKMLDRIGRINVLFEKGRHALELLEHYDENRELLLGRKRIDITLDKKLILKLKQEAKKKKIAFSRLVEMKLTKNKKIKSLVV